MDNVHLKALRGILEIMGFMHTQLVTKYSKFNISFLSIRDKVKYTGKKQESFCTPVLVMTTDHRIAKLSASLYHRHSIGERLWEVVQLRTCSLIGGGGRDDVRSRSHWLIAARPGSWLAVVRPAGGGGQGTCQWLSSEQILSLCTGGQSGESPRAIRN